MAIIISLSHLMTPTTTSKHVEAEITALQGQIVKLTELRDKYREEEKAGTRKP